MRDNILLKSGRVSILTKDEIAGILSFVVAIVLSTTAALYGGSLLQMEMGSPTLGNFLWPVSVGLIAAFVAIATVFAMMISLGLISAFSTPRLSGRTEYTIVGAGGVLGVGSALTIAMVAKVTRTGQLTALSDGSGEFLAAVAAMGLPLTYVFYELYKWDTTAIGTQQDSPPLDPDVVRGKTENWSDRNAATPARQQQNSLRTPKNETVSTTNQSGGGEAVDDRFVSKPDFSDMEFRWDTETNVSFADVGGQEDLKDELERDVIKPLITHREKAAELGVSAPNIVFHGPPGTGKTFTAKALATELGLPFAKLSGADIQSKWINESATKVQTLFKEAKTVAEQEGGAVVFLDELDTVLKNRDGNGNSHEEDTKVVNEFLNHLEDTKDHNVVFVGATNRLESLDNAGVRSGRIDKKLHVGKPDANARAAILRAQLADRPHQLRGDDVKRVVTMTDGLVASDLESIVTNAARHVLDRNGENIQPRDIKKGTIDLNGSRC